MRESLFYTAAEVEEMLGVSRAKAYRLIRDLNRELAEQGFIVIAGRIPKQFFNEHYYGLSTRDAQMATVQPT